MLTSNQAEVIRYLHARLFDVEPVGEDKVQVITTFVDRNGYVKRSRQIMPACLSSIAASYC